MTINARIALRLREMRNKKGLTQKELAELINTQQSVIARLEDATYEGHSLSILQRIAKALDLELVVDLRRPRK